MTKTKSKTAAASDTVPTQIASVNALSKEKLKANIEAFLRMVYRKTIQEATPSMVYHAVALAVKDTVINDWIITHRTYDEQQVKKLYYMSMEFLVGRALGNTIQALGQQKIVKEALAELGYDLVNIEDEERDPALGNGGLGRLAACFLDSLSTLNYPAYGCGIRYHYGMFRQKIENGYQVEIPDDWLKNGYPFEIKREEYTCEVK